MLKPLKRWLRKSGYRLRFLGRDIRMGRNPKIAWSSILRLHGGGLIQLGANVRIFDHAMLLTYGGRIEIGDDCSINPFCVLYGQGGLKIGNHVRIAAHSVLIPANHSFDEIDVPISQQPETCLGIEIGDDVWIGTGCRILDGVKIGRGCVVGAGAVVTKSLPDYSIAVGVPARVVGDRRLRKKAQ